MEARVSLKQYVVITLSFLLLVTPLAQAQYPLIFPKNPFLRNEYEYMHQSGYDIGKLDCDNHSASVHLQQERLKASLFFLGANALKAGMVASAVVVGLKKFEVAGQYHSWVSVLVFPFIWIANFPQAVMDIASLSWDAGKSAICQYTLSYFGSISLCKTLLKEDPLTALEIQLIIQWGKLPYNKQLQLVNGIFDLRRGQVQDTTHTFTALTNALSLPSTIQPPKLDLSLLKTSLEGLDLELVEALMAVATRHAMQSASKKGKKTSLFFEGPQGVGKTAAGRAVAKALGLGFCEISYAESGTTLMGTSQAMGKIAECMIRTKTINPVIILNEADRGLSAGGLAELLLLSDPNQTEVVDNFMSMSIPLDRLMVVYTANNPIEDLAFKDRVLSFFFKGFSIDYRLAYAKGAYLNSLLAQYEGHHTAAKDINPLIDQWGETLKQEESKSNVTHGSMRAVEKAVDQIFFTFQMRRQEQGLREISNTPQQESEALRNQHAHEDL